MDVATGPQQQDLLSYLDGRASSQQAFLRNAITFSDSQCKHLLYFLATHKHLRSSECNMDVETTPGVAWRPYKPSLETLQYNNNNKDLDHRESSTHKPEWFGGSIS